MPALRGMRLGAVAENTRSLREWLGLHEALVAALMFALVLVGAYRNVVFFGESLVHSNILNIVALRATERTHGPNFRPASVWFDRNLLVTAGLHDIGGTVTQWETGAISLSRGLGQGELPFWDPYVGGGAPAMSQLVQAFFFPPFLIVIALGNGVLVKNGYFLLLS